MSLPTVATPKYTTTVPSTGEKVTYRPFLVKEEKILLMAVESGDGDTVFNAIKDIISSCFSGIDVEALTQFDLEALLITLRSKSVGEQIKLRLPCEKEGCEHIQDIHIHLDDDLSLENEEMITEKSNRIVQISDDMGIELSYPPLSIVSEIDTNGSKFDAVYKLAASCIKYVFEGDEVYKVSEVPEDEFVAFVDSLPHDVFQKIEKFIAKTPAMATTIGFMCECGHETKKTIRGIRNFF